MIKKYKNFLMGWVIFGHVINYGMNQNGNKGLHTKMFRIKNDDLMPSQFKKQGMHTAIAMPIPDFESKLSNEKDCNFSVSDTTKSKSTMPSSNGEELHDNENMDDKDSSDNGFDNSFDDDEEPKTKNQMISSRKQELKQKKEEDKHMIDTSSKHQPIGQNQIDEIPLEDETLTPEDMDIYINERIEYVRISIENSTKTTEEKKMYIAATKKPLTDMITAICTIPNLKFGIKDLVDELINIVIESSEDRDYIIFRCNDQQKAMEEIVKTLMSFFPKRKFPKVYNALNNLLWNYLKKDITKEEILKNIELFLMKKELKKSYEDYREDKEIHGLIGIDKKSLKRFIDESLTKTRKAIEKRIKKEEQERYIKTTEKVLTPIIIKMFQIEMDITLIDQLINIVTDSENIVTDSENIVRDSENKVTQSENIVTDSENKVTESKKKDLSIWNCLGNDQRKIMNPIVRILMRVFPQKKFKKFGYDFDTLSRCYLQKDITNEQVCANKILFLMKKESEKYYKYYNDNKGTIPDGIQLIGIEKEAVMGIINTKIKDIKQDDPNKEAFKKAIIFIIIEMFRIPIEIFKIKNEEIDLRKKLIDIIINTLLNQLRTINDSHILNSLRHDQQKPMNPIVTTVMGFFPPVGDVVYKRLYKLLNSYLKGYLKNAEAQNAGFKVPDPRNKRNAKMSAKQDVPKFSMPAKSGMNHPDNIQGQLSYNVNDENFEIFTEEPDKNEDLSINLSIDHLMQSSLSSKKSGMNQSRVNVKQSNLVNQSGFSEYDNEGTWQQDLNKLLGHSLIPCEGQKDEDPSLNCSILGQPHIDETVDKIGKSNQLVITRKQNSAQEPSQLKPNEESNISLISQFLLTTNKSPIFIHPSMDQKKSTALLQSKNKPLTTKKNSILINEPMDKKKSMVLPKDKKTTSNSKKRKEREDDSSDLGTTSKQLKRIKILKRIKNDNRNDDSSKIIVSDPEE
jgi:hypothetical protein